MEEITKRMQDRIMQHQKENGFETIFDFLNEDLSELQEQLKNCNLQNVSNSEVFDHYGKPFTSGRHLWDFLTIHYNFTPKT